MKFDEAPRLLAEHLERTMGWDRARATQVAEISIDYLRTVYGGNSVYISRKNGVFRDRIIQEFNGRNITQLSRQYGVTAQTVRNYLKIEKNRKN